MQYMIMILIVIGLAFSDFAMGLIKGYCTDGVVSKKMRLGGLNKIGEVIVMITACGLEYGLHRLGEHYQAAELADIAGAITASAVFLYIVLMELVSILENYAAINPEAKWPLRFIRRLKAAGGTEEPEKEKTESA